MLDIQACKVSSSERSAGDLQAKRFVRAVTLKFKPEPRQTLEEARVVGSAVNGFSSGLPDPSDDVLIVEEEIVEEDALCDPLYLAFKGDRGLSAL